jgi:GNAT superfamily N-acetyltransferase
MTTIKTSSLTPPQKEEIFKLWNSVSPAHISHDTVESLDKYLGTLDNVVYTLTLNDSNRIVGWFADFDRENGRWFAMLLDKSIHGKGVGSQLLTQLKTRFNQVSGWVIDHNDDFRLDGKSYISPVNFYLKNGFELTSDTRLEVGQLSCVKMSWKKSQ